MNKPSPIQPTIVDRLWSEAKEVESLYKLFRFTKALPPSERRDSILDNIDHALSNGTLVPKSKTVTKIEVNKIDEKSHIFIELESRMKNVVARNEALERELYSLKLTPERSFWDLFFNR